MTIDTEMDADTHWVKSGPTEYTSIYDGVTSIFRPIWDQYDIHPIYLLSPEILMDDKCVDIFKREIEKGAIIGAHLHPECIEPHKSYKENVKIRTNQFPCVDCSYEVEKQKLLNLTELIECKLGVKPEWYRAARFGADDDSYRILDELGYKYDSSVTPGIDWGDRGGIDYRGFSQRKHKIEGTNLVEYPVTISGKRFGFWGRILPDNWLLFRWLRPTHMTYIEMKSLINEQFREGNNELVMMFHSMEIMINKTPYVRNRWMQMYYLWRMNKTFEYCRKLGVRM